MKIFVKSDDVNLLGRLKVFADESNKEYDIMKKGLKVRILGLSGKIPPSLAMIAYGMPGGAVIDTPLSPPDMEYVREAVKRYLRRDIGSPRWREKMISNLNMYLVHSGVVFDKIEFLEDEKYVSGSVQGKDEKSQPDGGNR